MIFFSRDKQPPLLKYKQPTEAEGKAIRELEAEFRRRNYKPRDKNKTVDYSWLLMKP